MTTFDFLALGVIALSAIVSMMRGLVVEVASLVSMLVSFVVARTGAPFLADVAFVNMQPRALAVTFSFFLLFAAAWLIQRWLRSLATSLLKAMGLGGVNRFLGAVFGVVKGVLVVTLAVLICAFTDLPRTPEWRHSETAFVFERLAEGMVPYLPSFVANNVEYPPE